MTENVPNVAVQTITYNRKTQCRKRADLLAAFPAEEVHHELGDKHCPDCQHELTEIGKQAVRQELLFIPAQLKRLDHIQHAYKCKYCSQRNYSDKIIKAAVPKAPLNHGLGSASLIAHSLYQKYEMKLPDYRQESETVTTYYWVFLSGKHDPYKITLYHHDPSRSGKVALNFLGDYPGYLHCDM